jgi:membrane fusion protein, multidrug efflux system
LPCLSSLPTVSLALLLAVLLAVASCSGEKKPPAQPPVPVLVAQVVAKDVPVELKAIGNVEAYQTVGIKARVGGQITQVNFQQGQDVNKGDLLFVIDPRPSEAALRQAEANLAKDRALANKAQADARRYAELIKKQFVSQQEYDQAKATAESLAAVVKADEVAVQNAKLQLSYCYIHAPISGRTGNLKADLGNLIKADADNPMVVINQIQPIYVSFAAPEANLSQVRKYMAQEKVPVAARISGEEQHWEEGVLTFVNNTVDQATGTILCRGTFANQDKRLWPGLFVNVVVKFTIQKGAVVVPSQAIQTSQEGQFVFVVQSDLSAEVRPVVVDRTFDGEVIVKQGLQPGERVVTDGQLRLVKGAKVEIKAGL